MLCDGATMGCAHRFVSGVVLALALTNIGNCVKINKLRVPEVIKHGSQAILDCDFTLENSDSELVLKWYFNTSLVYQWIPESKTRPRGLGVLRDRLNLDYAASPDAASTHRALHIIRTDPELSGDYTCSVSTSENEDQRTKRMLVFVPVSEKLFELKQLAADKGNIKVQCRADGVYPQPIISLHSQERDLLRDLYNVSVRESGDLWRATATATLPALPQPEVFQCRLHVPVANYTTRKETVIYPDMLSGAMASRAALPALLATLASAWWALGVATRCTGCC